MLGIDLDKKTFIFWKNQNNLYFASEIKGLIASGYEAKPNFKIWNDYLNFGKTDHNRHTFFKTYSNFFQENMRFKFNQNIKINKWYDFKKNILNKNNINNIKDEILDKLSDSIKINTRADVPLALSLSGGFRLVHFDVSRKKKKYI